MDFIHGLASADWTSIISLGIAGTTLAVVLTQERRFRKRASPTNWQMNAVGTVMRGEGEPNGHIISLSQYGSHTVRILTATTFECSPRPTEAHRLRTFMFRPGDSVDLEFIAENLDAAYILLTWISIEDRTIGGTEWIPLTATGPLDEARWEQRSKERRRQWWLLGMPREREMLRLVGPEYSPWRQQPRSLKKLKAIEETLEEVHQKEQQGFQGVLVI